MQAQQSILLMTVLYHRMNVVDAYLHLHRIGYCRDSEYTGRTMDTRRNILVREDGRPCLIDFSRARFHRCPTAAYSWLTTQIRFAPAIKCDELYSIIRETEVYENGELDPLAATHLAHAVSEYFEIFLRGGPEWWRYYPEKSTEEHIDEFMPGDPARCRDDVIKLVEGAIRKHKSYLEAREEKLRKRERE